MYTKCCFYDWSISEIINVYICMVLALIRKNKMMKSSRPLRLTENQSLKLERSWGLKCSDQVKYIVIWKLIIFWGTWRGMSVTANGYHSLEWWKCSAVKSWWLLHNLVNIQKSLWIVCFKRLNFMLCELYITLKLYINLKSIFWCLVTIMLVPFLFFKNWGLSDIQ